MISEWWTLQTVEDSVIWSKTGHLNLLTPVDKSMFDKYQGKSYCPMSFWQILKLRPVRSVLIHGVELWAQVLLLAVQSRSPGYMRFFSYGLEYQILTHLLWSIHTVIVLVGFPKMVNVNDLHHFELPPKLAQ